MNEQKTNTHVYEQKRTFRAPKKQKKNVPTRGERSAALLVVHPSVRFDTDLYSTYKSCDDVRRTYRAIFAPTI